MQKKIQVYIFKKTMRGYEFLLLKRNKEHGSIWAPVTGKVEKGESILDAAKREVKEETGISDIGRIIDPEYSFTFKDKKGDFKEHVFGFEVSPQVEEIKLSGEHQNYSWINFETALELLYWDSNKEPLKLLQQRLVPEK